MASAFSANRLADPRLREIHAYWDGKRGGRRMPSRRDLDPAEITTLLPYLQLLDVLGPPLDFRFRLVGTAVASICARDYTGARLSELPGKGRGSVLWNLLEEVWRTGEPSAETPPYEGRLLQLLDFASLALPLSDDGTQANMILHALSFTKSP